jgi:hypothetical protein
MLQEAKAELTALVRPNPEYFRGIFAVLFFQEKSARNKISDS